MTADTSPADVTDDRQTDAAALRRSLEALLMVADEPHSIVTLATATGAPVADVRAAVAALVADYDGHAGCPRRGFELREVGGGWRLYARVEYDDLITSFVDTQTPSRLSQAALETLAVIAYKQPVTRSQVAAVRAVNVDSVVRTLLARGLITEVGQDADTGAIRYGTTDALLQNLGINTLDELPPISPLLDDVDAVGADGFVEETAR